MFFANLSKHSFVRLYIFAFVYEKQTLVLFCRFLFEEGPATATAKRAGQWCCKSNECDTKVFAFVPEMFPKFR